MVLMRIVNGCRHFLKKKKEKHKKSAQFLIAFLMMLVLFANGMANIMYNKSEIESDAFFESASQKKWQHEKN